MKKRICVLSTLYPPIVKGGAEISTQLVVNELSERYSVKVISVNLIDETVREQDDGIEIVRVACRNNGLYEHRPTDVRGKIISRLQAHLDFSRHRHVHAEILDFKPDLVWLNNLNALAPRIAFYLRGSGIKLVQTVRDYRPICDKMMVKNGRHCQRQCLRCKLIKSRIKQNYHLYDATVGISDFVGNRLRESGYAQKESYGTIYNPIADLSAGEPAEPKKGAKFTVGFMGSLTANKGIDLFLKIAASLPEIDFKIASQMAMPPDRMVTKNVQLLGLMQPKDFFNNIDCLLVPSQWEEPFGRVAAEGLSAKVPVFVSDRGGLPEIVVNGISGEVHPANNHRTWVSAIKQLQSDPGRAALYVLNGYKRYEEKFALKQVSMQYSRLFERVFAGDQTTANE